MALKGEKLMVCPSCTKKGVAYVMGRGRSGEDAFKCRYCDWYAFGQGHDRPDVISRRALAAANPDREVWVADPDLINIYLEDS
jgi:hypothetical protein